MIRFEDVTITYDGSVAPVISHVNLHIQEGELALVVGPTGSGKTTLLHAINGLVPHFSGGTLSGRVVVDGRDTATHPPRELADVVGVVPQDPMSGFVTDYVEDELAYGMECLGLAPAVMRQRVEEIIDLLGLAEIRDRALLSLSGGQRQRVAIGAVMTTHPRILVLDEPTSALDPGAAEEVLAALQRLVHDLGVTVVLAEHRLERVVQYADRIIHVPGNGAPVQIGTAADIMRTASVAPPVVQLGRLAGWNPLPLSVRDARRNAEPLRERLRSTHSSHQQAVAIADTLAPRLLDARCVSVAYGTKTALDNVSLTADPGEILAIMGRNGAGKSTLLGTLVGLHKRSRGSVLVSGGDPADMRGPELISRVGLVPQDPSDLLSRDTVDAECHDSDRDAQAPRGTTATILRSLAPDVSISLHPRDLSEGQRLALALSVILAARPPLVLLDEPTRGLDYLTKSRLVEALRILAAGGHAVVLATHDVELVAEVATRVIVLADGEIVADGTTRDVIAASPLFAPQVWKVLAPQEWLTVAEVEQALGGVR
jgi:energy-coupling factor transporter ATP-binding protein EcfA2